MRDVSCAFHVVVRAGNTARGLTFERVKANGVYRAAASVESWGEPTFADMVFHDVQIACAGGHKQRVQDGQDEKVNPLREVRAGQPRRTPAGQLPPNPGGQ